MPGGRRGHKVFRPEISRALHNVPHRLHIVPVAREISAQTRARSPEGYASSLQAAPNMYATRRNVEPHGQITARCMYLCIYRLAPAR